MKRTPVRMFAIVPLMLLHAAAFAASATTGPTSLDLKVADVSKLFSPAELREAMGTQQTGLPEVSSASQLDTVIVETGDNQVVKAKTDLPLGFAAMAWGVQHPTQLWRLFVPVTFSEER